MTTSAPPTTPTPTPPPACPPSTPVSALSTPLPPSSSDAPPPTTTTTTGAAKIINATNELIQCITFATPQAAIQGTFQHLLQLIQQQQTKHDELATSHALLQHAFEQSLEQTRTQQTQLKAELQTELKEQLSGSIAELQNRVGTCEENYQQLLDRIKEMEGKHKHDMDDIGGSIRVMAYNLGFADEEQDEEGSENNEEEKKTREDCIVDASMAREEEESGGVGSEDSNASLSLGGAGIASASAEIEQAPSSSRIGKETEADNDNESEHETPKSSNTSNSTAKVALNDSDAAPTDGASISTCPSKDEEKEEERLVARTLMKKQSGRRLTINQALNASKGGEKLAFNQTLLSRLENLEDSFGNLRRCLDDKGRNNTAAVADGVNENNQKDVGHVDAQVSEVAKRVGTIEHFLDGCIAKDEDNADSGSTKGVANDDTAAAKEEEMEADVQQLSGNPQGNLSVLLHLQHETTKSSLDDLDRRIDSLSDQLSSRVTRTSMDNHISQLLKGIDGTDASALAESIKDLQVKVVEMSNKVESAKTISPEEVATALTPSIDNSNDDERWNNFKRGVDESIRHLEENMANKSDVMKEIEQSERRMTDSLGAKCDQKHLLTSESIRQLRESLDSCKDGFTTTSEGGTGTDDDSLSDGDDSRLQEALSIIEASQSTIKTMEQDISILISKLAEKPDLSQVQSMLESVEESYKEKLAGHDALRDVIDEISKTLKQRMTRAEVTSVVNKALEKARLGLDAEKDSLMIGRAPYRCIGCNSIFPGVNNNIASKVNHNALPGAVGKTFYARRYFHVKGHNKTGGKTTSRKPRHSASSRISYARPMTAIN